MNKATLKISLLAILACVIWGSAFPGAKIGFEYTGPIFLSGLRFTLAGLLLVPVMLALRIDMKAPFRYWRFTLVFAFLQTFMQYGLFFMGLDKVPASTSAIIIGAGPLFVALMAHFTLRDDRLTWRKIGAIALGISGVIFISLTKGGLAEGTSPGRFYTGVALLIGSNLMGSYTNIMVVKKERIRHFAYRTDFVRQFYWRPVAPAGRPCRREACVGSVSRGVLRGPPVARHDSGHGFLYLVHVAEPAGC